MAKATWKGSINFGLVSIDVALFVAVKEHIIGFKLLHAKCNNPVLYKRWCDYCSKEVVWEDIVKGIKLKDGSYFILTEQNLKKLKPTRTNSIDIVEFVDRDEILSVYQAQHYYVIPQKINDKSYFVFIKALQATSRVAIGQFVLRDKEYVCMLEPLQDVLCLTVLNYSYEIQKIQEVESLDMPKKISDQEIELAKLLIDKLSKKKFDLTKFKDTFVVNLLENIKKSKKGLKAIKEIPKKKKKIEQKSSLMSNLKASLEKYTKKAGK